ncbi:MAG TPA: carbohydrate ABC transporter permease [Chloroflexota bacterium]|nr:carbohydrate ABC transporter permease [Chloroflexota bacterium]
MAAVALARPWAARVRLGRVAARAAVLGALSVGAVLMAAPFLWLLSSALKDPSKIWLFPPQWIPNPVRWSNFAEALTSAPFPTYARNTLVIVLANEVGVLASASLAAYGFARLRFPGRDLIFMVLLSTIMLPWAVVMVPNYIIFRQLGWLDTPLPLIVPHWFGGGPFYIFLLRQFFRTLPADLSDAARIDGCGELGIYARIILPLAKSALAAVAIFVFLQHWNDFMAPLIYLSKPSNLTLSLGLAAFRDVYSTQWHYLMAASVVVVIPSVLVFFFAQRHFVQGIAMTGMRA